MGLGTVGSIMMGSTVTILASLSGDLLDSYAVQENMMGSGKNVMLQFIYVACAAFVVGLILSLSWHTSAERQAQECRKQYFRSILQQELAWFDTQ
jgi:ATP-binding cassette, subfamily B (MDR/TAP), member 1